MSDKQPVYVVPDSVSRTLGRDAQRNNILAARVVADIVKTTLGPKGMDKMIVDSTGNIIVTNDGVTILEEIELDHPAAKAIVEIAKTQENEVGDGTTTVVMLAGKLLENAEKLLDKRIHPTVIIKGYRVAADRAHEILKEISYSVSDRSVLKNIAMTSMTGKGAEGDRDRLAELIVSAVDQVAVGKEVDSSNILIKKFKGEGTEKSELIHGIVLDKEVVNQDMPKKVENARIALIDFALELKNPETETKVSISSPEQLRMFLESEERSLKEMTEALIKSGANVIFCQKGIDDVAQYYLAKAGIFACRRVSKSDLEKLAKATSGNVVSNLADLTPESFGYAAHVEERKHGDDSVTYVTGCNNPKAVSIIVHGSTDHIADEIERALKDGIGVVSAAVKEGRMVCGGGAVEVELSRKLREFARTIGGREQLAVEEFANALETIPETLAENAGLDPIDMLTQLKKKHESGSVKDGLNLLQNRIEDCFAAGILEPLKVKTQAVRSATEVASMILRIDDVLVSAEKPQRSQPYQGLD